MHLLWVLMFKYFENQIKLLVDKKKYIYQPYYLLYLNWCHLDSFISKNELYHLGKVTSLLIFKSNQTRLEHILIHFTLIYKANLLSIIITKTRNEREFLDGLPYWELK